MRGGPSVKKADEAKDALNRLAEAGKGTWMRTTPAAKGGPPNDLLLLFNATNTDKTEGSPPHAGA